MKSPHDHALAILKKAANDLMAAQTVLETGAALDTVCFHAQQTAEKCLKALLAMHEVQYPWRHDLGELFVLVKPLAPAIEPFEERLIRLTPYAVEVRYDAEFEPSVEQARDAVHSAAEVYALAQIIISFKEP